MHSVVRAGQAAEWGVGVYVRIHGKISDFDNKKRVQAFQIKPVTDFNEARASVPAAHAGGPAPACQRAPVCACLRGQGPCGSEAVFGAQARQRPPACRGAVAGGCEDGACRAPAADGARAGSRRALSPRLRAQVTYHLLKCIFQHAHLTKGGAGGAGGAAARPRPIRG